MLERNDSEQVYIVSTALFLENYMNFPLYVSMRPNISH